jgi:hypothetical protein
MGLPEETRTAVERLAEVFEVVETSPVLACRGDSRQVRLYLEVRL